MAADRHQGPCALPTEDGPAHADRMGRVQRMSVVVVSCVALLLPGAVADAGTPTQVAPVTVPEGGYVLDGWGGLHPFGGAPVVAPGGYWPGWDIARAVVTRADGRSGYVVDGWGGLHAFGGAPRVAPSGYWPGWDIVRGLALRPDGASGYVLDGWGGLHPFGGAPRVAPSGYWPGWDITRGLALDACDASGTSGWVLDAYGGLHPFGGAPPRTTWYLPGVDLARGITSWCRDGRSAGYVVDAWGRLHPFGAAPIAGTAMWPGWDIARGVVMNRAGDGGWVLDGWGGLHAFGGARPVAPSGYWPGWDIARGVGANGGGGGSTSHWVGRTLRPLQGTGAWVDLFDWSLTYTGGAPTVGLADIDAMAAAGMETLFIQVTRIDAPTDIVEPARLATLLDQAHRRGMRTCAWFLPGLADPAVDQRKVAAIARLDVDCVAVDIEPTVAQTDPAARNANLISLSRYARATVPRAIPLAAIVLPPVVTEILNPSYWPDFPWSSISGQYDVWMPMSYWTNRPDDSIWRDPYLYTTENVRRLRIDLADPGAIVHVIGGIGDRITEADLVAFRRAAVDTRSIGLGIYDWASTPPPLRDDLRG